MPVSVLILTRNEAFNLPGCLASVSWSDDVVVFDSHSTDATTDIARDAGARVFRREFDNYAAQRNAALEQVRFKHPWVWSVDADERIPAELRAEVAHAVRTAPAEVAAFRVRFRNYLFGRWIRRSSLYPTWVIRLFRPERVRYEARQTNAHPVVAGEVWPLREHFDHLVFNRGLSAWFDRHNTYSSMEAAELLAARGRRLDAAGLACTDPLRRRRAWKQLAYRLPGRPLLVFAYLLLVRGGFLDGGPGFTYCTLRGIYEYMIDVKVKELRRRAHDSMVESPPRPSRTENHGACAAGQPVLPT